MQLFSETTSDNEGEGTKSLEISNADEITIDGNEYLRKGLRGKTREEMKKQQCGTRWMRFNEHAQFPIKHFTLNYTALPSS
ncbi:CLUMA_CG000468, isoform A [Clunio marinus]|uniref:CLUMA_CG000468, isoform A n=1 Tax=Clunio marinus TaxID=568069 RepID=A0A1J1HF71_9DIPT|nr:CLUMA_CG000468, isoform A [Clunio marinus]